MIPVTSIECHVRNQIPVTSIECHVRNQIPVTSIESHVRNQIIKGNNKITELRTILQRESQNS